MELKHEMYGLKYPIIIPICIYWGKVRVFLLYIIIQHNLTIT